MRTARRLALKIRQLEENQNESTSIYVVGGGSDVAFQRDGHFPIRGSKFAGQPDRTRKSPTRKSRSSS